MNRTTKPQFSILYVTVTRRSPAFASDVLSDAGYVLQTVNGAADALRALRVATTGPANALPDLIVWEVPQPEYRGLKVCKALKAQELSSCIPFVYLCLGPTSRDHQIVALEQGVDSYIAQPRWPLEVLALIKGLLRIKASEATLRRDAAYLDQLLNGASGPIISWDESNRIIHVNSAVEALTGLSREVLQSKTANEFFPSALDPVPLAAPFEAELVHTDGTRHTILWSVNKAAGLNGNTPAATIAQGLDISQRKLSDMQLRIAAIAFDCQEGLSVTDQHGNILRVNNAFCAITGYAVDEVIGKNPRMLSAQPKDAALYKDMWEQILHSGKWQGEVLNCRKTGERYTEWLTITAVKTSAGIVTHYVGTHADISRRKANEQEIRALAFFDPLTGLPNRRLLRDRLEQAQSSSARSGRDGALLFIDIDHFKILNDSHGHDRGDLLLKQVAKRLSMCVREGDTVARQGGDEFVVILKEVGQVPLEAATQAEEIGRKILASISGDYDLDGLIHHCTVSIGATLFSDHQETIEQLLKQADLAMYQVKSLGRNALRFFDQSMQTAVDARSALEQELRRGLQTEQFLLYYQVQVDDAGRIDGAEALVRWQHPERGLVLPGDFIAFAEETGLIIPLGQWVLETACVQLAVWATQPAMAQVTMTVNVSAREFRQGDYVQQVQAVLERTKVNPHNLILELTESMLMQNIDDVIEKMNALKSLGIRFALDDFGVGFSCLSSLQRLPLKRIKIDQSFVSDILTNGNDAAIVGTIVDMARNLKMGVIAEGVETQGQRDFLLAVGCHYFQGFLFGSPQSVDKLGCQSLSNR
jgi:diguanylate cyclase (GGDEF)-like protein/PAS domain S-box-containing protein